MSGSPASSVVSGGTTGRFRGLAGRRAPGELRFALREYREVTGRLLRA